MENFEDLKLKIEDIEKATNNFDKNKILGQGGFGIVFKGEMHISGVMTEVAVKCLLHTQPQAEILFKKEIILVSSLRHENLISLIGFCDEGSNMIIVYEYAANKSLDCYIEDPNLTWIQRLKICIGAARGLANLHDPKGTQQRIIHRDIKSANILLDRRWNAKIADFGLSKYGPANQKNTFTYSSPMGTVSYCDPTYALTNLLTKESDVYSFGVVLFEVLCARFCSDDRYEPHDPRRNLTALIKNSGLERTLDMFIKCERRQQMDHKSYETFVNIACECVDLERKRRPLMSFVVERLQMALSYQEIFEGKSQEPDTSLRSIKLRQLYNPLEDFEKICPPGGSDSLVLYTAKVKTISKTLEDCISIRSLLNSYGVSFDERDVQVHWCYKEELSRILGRRMAPPRLFIKGRYIGGADEVLQLHDQGKLRRLLDGIPKIISKGPSTKE